MSVMRPVGPLPARVYWVRRVLLVALVLLALLIASWAWGAVSGGGGSNGTPGQSPASSPVVSPSASGTSPSPTPSVSKSPSPSPSVSKTGTATPACADSAIQVVATPSKTTYQAGEDPRFTIKVVNTSKATCTRDVGQKAMEVKVSQGSTLIWSSDHCAPGGAAKVVTLKAGAAYTTSVVWARTESKTGCPNNQPDAPKGTYALTGRNLNVSSQPAAFALAT